MDHPNQGGDKDRQFPALLGQDEEDFFEGLEFLDERNSLKLQNPQTWNFGNRSVSGTEQRAPAAPEFAYNENQTLASHDKELFKQKFDQLIADALKMVQLPTMLSGPPDASYSMDQFGTLPASGTQLLENQMPAGIQPLDPAAEKLKRKRASGRAYCQRRREERQRLEDENDWLLNRLSAQMPVCQKQLPCTKCAKLEAEVEFWKKQYLLLTESRQNQLDQRVEAMEKQIKNMEKQCIEKPKKKLKKQVMMAETAEETKNDN